jgi:hypothetical protein
MKLNLDISGARLFGRRLAFALSRRFVSGTRPVRTVSVTVPPSRDKQSMMSSSLNTSVRSIPSA